MTTYSHRKRGRSRGVMKKMPTPLPADGAGPVRVLLVEDHKLLRLTLSLAFEELPDIELVAEATLAGAQEPWLAAATRKLDDIVALAAAADGGVTGISNQTTLPFLIGRDPQRLAI